MKEVQLYAVADRLQDNKSILFSCLVSTMELPSCSFNSWMSMDASNKHVIVKIILWCKCSYWLHIKYFGMGTCLELMDKNLMVGSWD